MSAAAHFAHRLSPGTASVLAGAGFSARATAAAELGIVVVSATRLALVDGSGATTALYSTRWKVHFRVCQGRRGERRTVLDARILRGRATRSVSGLGLTLRTRRQRGLVALPPQTMLYEGLGAFDDLGPGRLAALDRRVFAERVGVGAGKVEAVDGVGDEEDGAKGETRDGGHLDL